MRPPFRFRHALPLSVGLLASFIPRGAHALDGTGTGRADANVPSSAGKNSLDAFHGSFGYSVAIAVPDYHGLEPKIALTYNSQGRNGPVGHRWSLQGFSTIEYAPLPGPSNKLLFDGRQLSGAVADPIVDAEAKRAALVEAREELGLVQEDVLAIGDGANDRLMVEEAGFGVAYRAKPALAEVADARLDHHGLDALLWAQGIRRKDWVKG